MNSGEKTAHRKASEYIYSVLSMIIAIFTAIMLLFLFFVRIVSVSGDSMNPTLVNGSKIFVSSFLYNPSYGDIIAFGKAEGEDTSVIKRVIGLPGDTIDINFETHIITVNGEIYVDKISVSEAISEQGDIEFPVTVPEDCVFVLGDNRNNSIDSRFSRIGFVQYNEILGKAVFSLVPFFPIK